MQKKLGALVLTLSALVISAACASLGAPPKPQPMQPDSGETWAKAGPSQLRGRTNKATTAPSSRLAASKEER
jgi:hypothetical protein